MKYYARSLDRKYLYPGTLAITGCLLMCQYHMTESMELLKKVVLNFAKIFVQVEIIRYSLVLF